MPRTTDISQVVKLACEPSPREMAYWPERSARCAALGHALGERTGEARLEVDDANPVGTDGDTARL